MPQALNLADALRAAGLEQAPRCGGGTRIRPAVSGDNRGSLTLPITHFSRVDLPAAAIARKVTNAFRAGLVEPLVRVRL